MECTSPNLQYFDYARRKLCFGKLKFWQNSIYQYTTDFVRKLPCKKCINCYVTLAQQKAIRCVHESSMYDQNIFTTMTYADNSDIYLNYQHMQHFKMRMTTHCLRKNLPKPRYFHVGEYGETNERKHWHMIIFNYHPLDYSKYKLTPQGDQLYISPELDKLWTHGYCNFGQVNYKTASYVAKYQLKSFVDPNNDQLRLESIKKGMPNKPALGIPWLKQNWKNTFNNGYVMYYDEEIPIPQSYIDWLEKNEPEEWINHHSKRNYEEVFKTETLNWLHKTNLEKREVNSPLYRNSLELKHSNILHEFNKKKGTM